MILNHNDKNALYIAKARTIIDSDMQDSKVLGVFLVKPVYRIGISGKYLSGYNEAISGERLINLSFIPTTYMNIDTTESTYVDSTCKLKTFISRDICSIPKEEDGDISWDVNRLYPVEQLLPAYKIEEYLSQSPESIKKSIELVRNSTKSRSKSKNLSLINRPSVS